MYVTIRSCPICADLSMGIYKLNEKIAETYFTSIFYLTFSVLTQLIIAEKSKILEPGDGDDM